YPGYTIRYGIFAEENDPSLFLVAFDRFDGDRLRTSSVRFVLLYTADGNRCDFSQHSDLPYPWF
ncbi:hypothetical protein C241_27030, partial [Bradyrhizobium lupini HPC(L)]